MLSPRKQAESCGTTAAAATNDWVMGLKIMGLGGSGFDSAHCREMMLNDAK